MGMAGIGRPHGAWVTDVADVQAPLEHQMSYKLISYDRPTDPSNASIATRMCQEAQPKNIRQHQET